MENTFEGWDTEGEDFFAEVDGASSEQNPEPIIPSNKTEEEGQEDPGSENDTDSEQEEDLFDTPIVNQNSGEEEEEEEREDSNEDKGLDNISVIKDLKRRGLIDFQLEDDEELTEELAGDLLEDSYDKSIENRIKDKLKKLPDHSKSLMEYILKGGNPRDFISASEGSSLSEDLDMDKVSDQELVMKDKLRREGNDEEFIKSQIEFLKDSGNLQKQANRQFSSWLENKKTAEKENLKRIEDNKIATREAERKDKRELEDFMSKDDNLSGLSIPNRLKKELPSYIKDKSVLLDNGTSITEMQKELFYNIPKNNKAMIQLASLLKNRNKDGTFNLDSISRKEETKITRKVKNEIRSGGEGIPASSGGRVNQSKSLAELLS